MSLLHGDGDYPAAEAWLAGSADQALWISHWVLLEFTSATAIRLSGCAALSWPVSRRNPRASPCSGLQGADALHLAIAHRHGLTKVTADQARIKAAEALRIPAQQVASA